MDIHFLSGSGIVAENSAGKSTPKSATDFPRNSYNSLFDATKQYK